MPATLDFSAHGELVEPLDFSQGGELVADGPPKLPLADFLANLSPQDRARQADLARMESESPAQAFGKAMGKAGRGLYNVAQAYGFEAVGDPEDQAKQLGVSDPALKKAGLLTEPSPSEGGRPSDQGIAALPGAGKVLAKGARGLVETAPQLAAVAGAQAMGVPAPLAAAAVFGSTEEGFSPEQAAVAAALPFVGKYSGRIIGALAKKLGVSGERALQLWKSAGAMAGAAGYLAAIDESKIQNLPTEQRDQARIDMVAGLIGQSVLGPMGVEKEPARAGTADIKPPMPRAMEPAKAGTPSPEVTPDAEIQAGINKALVEAPQPKEPDATQAGQQQESISGKREGDEAQRPPAETSAGGGVQPATESPPAQGAEGDVLLNIQKLARLPAGEFGGAFAAKENAYELGDRARTAEHLAALRSAAENAAREFSSASLQAAKEKFQSDPHNQVMNLAQKKKQFFDEAVRAAAPQVAAEQSGWKYQGVNYGGNINERDPGFGDWYERMLKQEAEGEKKVERLWEFTDHRQGSPTEGITTYVDEGASHEAIVDALKNKTAEVLAAKARHVTAEQVTQLDPNKVPPTQVNPKEVFLSPDVPNFKRAADPETGLVPGQQLQGEYSHSPVNALIVWRRKNGRLEIVTGRHRLDLAQRNHEPAVYVQVMDESAGYTLKNALMADAEANIKDGNGEVEDYANYFRHNPGLAREAAQVKGLFSRAKGRDGWTLGRDASDDLYAAYQAGKTTEAQALEIARAATGNAAAQQIGLKFALQGKPPEFLANVVKAAMSESGGRERALDLFGRDDSAMRAMEEQAKRAGTLQADLRAQIAAASGAAKNPEAARKLGVDVNDPASVKARVQQLRGELVRWENWPLHPDLVAKVKGVSAPASEKPAPETPAPVAPAPKLGSGQKQGDLIASTQREDLSLAGEKGTDAERLAAEKARAEKSAAEAKASAEKRQQTLAGISAGPGAASPGDVPQASQLAQLTGAITAGMPVDSPLPEALRWIEQVKTRAANAKEAAANLLAKTKAMADALWDSYTRLKPVTDEKRAVGRWDYAMQRADHEARQFVKAIQKAVPDKLRREAMTNWIQADGDEGLLRQRAAASKPNARPGYEMALRLTPAEKTLAGNIREYLDSQLQKGREAGLLSAGVDNYVNQVWNRDLLNRENPFVKGLRSDFAAEKLQPDFRFARKRFFDSYFAGEQAGYKPRNKDVGALMAVYDQAFRKAIAARAFLRDLHEAKAGDGRPLVEISGYGRPLTAEDRGPATLIDPKTKSEETSDYRKIDHPAMRGWKWAGRDAAGNPIFLKGDLVVHPDAYARLRNRLQTSWWRQHPAARFYLTASTAAKQSLLSFAGFHQVQETIHSLGHRVNPMSLDAVDFDEPLTRELVHGGLKLADYHAEELFGEGLASGGWVHKIPVLGNKILRPYTEYLFQDYIPKLKVTMAREAFERNLKRYAGDLAGGKVTREQLAELTGNQANAAFGGLNYRAMGRNPSFQDTLRAFLLAPDFLEARAKFVGQAAAPYGREQLVALGIIAATSYVGARLLNELIDGDPHWNKPFSVVAGGKEYSLRTVPGDIHHLLTDPRSFWYHRLSSGSRAAVELGTGRDDRGVKRNLIEQAKDALANLVPLSLHKRDDVKLWEAFANSMGLQERRFSASQEIGAAARKFRDAHHRESPYEEIYDAEKDVYRPLRLALQSQDAAAAQKAYDALRKTEAPGAIIKNIRRYFHKPFTGSEKLEAKFVAQLDPHDRERYRQARQEQRDALQSFWQVRR